MNIKYLFIFLLCFPLAACAIFKPEKPTLTVDTVEVIQEEDDSFWEIQPNGYKVVPVLVYHAIKKKPKQMLDVSTKEFDLQMNYLHKEGYKTLSISDFFEYIYKKKAVPENSILITFDDGRRSVYTEAYPILKKYGFTATVFLYSDSIVQKYPSVLTKKMLVALSTNGFDIEAHSKTHKRNIPQKKQGETNKGFKKRLKKELTAPKQIIENYINQKVLYYAYPFGQYSEKFITLAKKAGYKGGFTVAGAKNLDGNIIKKGGNPFFVNPFEINRIQISQNTHFKLFKKNIKTFHTEPIYSPDESPFNL